MVEASPSAWEAGVQFPFKSDPIYSKIATFPGLIPGVVDTALINLKAEVDIVGYSKI